MANLKKLIGNALNKANQFNPSDNGYKTRKVKGMSVKQGEKYDEKIMKSPSATLMRGQSENFINKSDKFSPSQKEEMKKSVNKKILKSFKS